MADNKNRNLGIRAIDIYIKNYGQIRSSSDNRILYIYNQAIYLNQCLDWIYNSKNINRETKVLIENYILDDTFIKILLSPKGQDIVVPLLKRFCSDKATDNSISDIIENMPIEKLEELYNARVFKNRQERLDKSNRQYKKAKETQQQKRYSA